jgi:hypothetical protein
VTEQTAVPAAASSPSLGTRRVAALTWGLVFSALFGTFLVGGIVQGYFELEVEEISSWIEAISAIVFLIPGAFALAWTAGRRVHLSPVIRYGLVLPALATGYLLGSTMPSEKGTADDAAWLGSPEGRWSLILLGLCLVAALVVSLRRYPSNESAPPEPTIEEKLYGRRMTG